MRLSSLFFALGLGAYAWLACSACGKTGGEIDARARAKLQRDPPTPEYGFHPVRVLPHGARCPGSYSSAREDVKELEPAPQ